MLLTWKCQLFEIWVKHFLNFLHLKRCCLFIFNPFPFTSLSSLMVLSWGGGQQCIYQPFFKHCSICLHSFEFFHLFCRLLYYISSTSFFCNSISFFIAHSRFRRQKNKNWLLDKFYQNRSTTFQLITNKSFHFNYRIPFQFVWGEGGGLSWEWRFPL